jgi:beta-galactosidase/beta-glucuronidase
MKDAPLMTEWSSDVDAKHPWPEYPRPQMERSDWLNLNGQWDYAILDKKNGLQAPFQGKILVPYPIESALSGVMKRVNENQVIVYHRTFRIPSSWNGQRVLLHFGAVDWETVAVVNGKRVGEHRGGYDAFTFDITDALSANRDQEIQVTVFDPTEGGQPRGKQVRDPKGIYYTPSSGIWQTVWLEPVPRNYISDFKITPDVDNQSLRVIVDAKGGDLVQAIAYSHGHEVGRATGDPGKEFSIRIDKPHLWSPEDPYLYNLKIELLKGHTPRAAKDGTKYGENFRTVDRVKSYFAMRKVSLGKDEQGITRPMLNGKFVFQVGPLDQGFWPDGLYTAPTDAAMRYDLEKTKEFGFNMTRKHVKTEPDRWYYYCDKMGLLVWQDMPSGNNKTAEDKAEFERELKQLVETHYNHPSIYMWVVFNEGWGQYDTERLTGWVKKMDPSRLVDNATGWTDMKCGDVIDMHNYPGPGSPQPEPDRAAVLGEFGGLGLGIDGHTWTQKTWGYQGMSDREALTRRYVNLLRKAFQLKQHPGLSAIVYTQITDVETECNGLMTYDRAIIKPNVKKKSRTPTTAMFLPNRNTR